MRYSVPQFIDIKDRIIGPLTISQFIYLFGGGGISYIAYRMIPQPVSYFFVIVLVGVSLLFAFYKVNGRPFIETVQGGFFYMISKKLYLWKYEAKKKAVDISDTLDKNKKTSDVPANRQPTGSHLKDLAWSLDVLDKS